jgi:hypothetical protein
MGFEIDFLAVGEGARSGDAIALRWGNLYGPRDQQFVMVIDGGNKESGANLVDHIQGYYGTSDVDLVLNTHPDADHASGLSVVLEELTVKKLWMHRPWTRLQHIYDLVQDGRITQDSLQARIEEALEAAYDLEQIAEDKGIPIWEPFTSVPMERGGATIRVLGPSRAYYTDVLLPQFDDMPELHEAAVATYSEGRYRFSKSATVFNSVRLWTEETLEDPDEDEVRAENNSSVILLLQIDGRQILLTGDAGVPALRRAYLRDHTRDKQAYPFVFRELTHYGFLRNLWGLRATGIVFAVLSLVVTATWLAVRGPWAWDVRTLAPGLNLLAIGLWSWWPDTTSVRHAAESYAKALLTAGYKMAGAAPPAPQTPGGATPSETADT